ncbi:RIP defective [Neurospora tetraspora]|uniref:DNA (cytosine-5-)-methyltransferase n=1 Tax=Neurospora tetraspora TaxID=94610 RepID=A0AAE0MX18_9PEZI|nr:RIP defective [Neurospora tetraspora]
MAEICEPNSLPGGEQNPFVVDDEDDVIQIHDEEELEEQVAEVIDITEDGIEPFEFNRGPRSRPGEEILPSFLLRDQGFIIRPGMTVELKEPEPIGKFFISFVRVTSIARQAFANNVTIRGHGFTRAKEMNGMLPKQLNECCLIALVDTHDPRPCREKAMIDIKPENILTTRELRVTNAAFPQHRDNAVEIAGKRQQIKDMGVLVSRYTYVEHHQIDQNKPREWAFMRVEEEDADENFRVSGNVLVNGWRGGKVPGGSLVPAERTHGRRPMHIHNLDDPTTSTAPGPINVPFNQKYTAGDTFAGAGGASRGITDSGVHLEFCVDNWEHAIASLKANFNGTTIYDTDMHDFIVDKDIKHRVDILHLSPPCQVWSPAHTRPGQNDEKNLAILFSCTHLIEKIRPRLFTVEQTFGILHPRFENFFQSLVRGFTDHGYSVRWKVVNFSHYGLPQPRRRLIMIGAGPGEKLPPFPAPTHSPDVSRNRRHGGLKSLTTARQALAAIDGRRRYPLHQPYLQQFPIPRAPWDGDKPLPYTVTCGAAENYHWSGERQFTPLEYALLQGFPMHHKFAGNYIKKQIGNAFPPIFVKLLYKHLVNWLDTQDNVVRQARIEGVEPFRTPTVRRHVNIERREEDEVTFLSSRKRRQLDAVDLIDEDDNIYNRKRARLDITPSQPKQKTVIDLDEDISNLELDQDNDDARSDSATIRESSVDSPRGSSPSTPFSTSASPYLPVGPPGSSHHTPGLFVSPKPPAPSPLGLGLDPPSKATSSTTQRTQTLPNSSSSNTQSVRRKLFLTVPPPRTEPFSSPSSTSSTSSSATSSSSSAPASSSGSSSSGAEVKKENQKGTKEEPMELSD